MKVLSCGAGMQSTALALMSCENKMKGIIHKEVPIYDAVVFCDLGLEPYWVKDQVEFIKNACEKAGILLKSLIAICIRIIWITSVKDMFHPFHSGV